MQRLITLFAILSLGLFTSTAAIADDDTDDSSDDDNVPAWQKGEVRPSPDRDPLTLPSASAPAEMVIPEWQKGEVRHDADDDFYWITVKAVDPNGKPLSVNIDAPPCKSTYTSTPTGRNVLNGVYVEGLVEEDPEPEYVTTMSPSLGMLHCMNSVDLVINGHSVEWWGMPSPNNQEWQRFGISKDSMTLTVEVPDELRIYQPGSEKPFYAHPTRKMYSLMTPKIEGNELTVSFVYEVSAEPKKRPKVTTRSDPGDRRPPGNTP